MGRSKGPVKQKQGKNKKRTWKQIQHDDVEQFLDDVRQDERLGGIRSKTNDELFSIDHFGILGEDELLERNRKAPVSPAAPPLKGSKSEDEPLVRIEDLKCFRLLKPHTSVPDPLIKRNRVKLPGENKSLKMVTKDRIRLSKKKIMEQKPQEVCLDPWAAVEPKGDLDSEWIESSIKRHNLRPRVLRAQKHITSQLPAVDAPHPGFSYNPTFKDHQDLIRAATEIETDKLDKEKRLIRATAPTKCDSIEIDYFSPVKEEDEPIEELEDAKDVKPLLNPRVELKTKKKRRKEKEESEKKRTAQQKKMENTRSNEVFRIKTINKEIVSEEKKQKDRLAKVAAAKTKYEKYGQKKLSKFKYEEPTLNPALSEELQGTLIGIPSNNSLLMERFKSLQKRNILEPRLKNTNKRKNRVKTYVRASDKMEWEKTGFWEGIKVKTV